LIYTDTEAFRSAIAEERWAEALELYRGDFLPGFHVGDAWAFGEWVEAERERLRELAAGAAWALAREQIQRGVLMEAERTAQRAFGLVWSDETPVREFMREMAAAGDRVAALNFFERFCQKIKTELDVEPSPETREVADAIRNGDLVTTSLSPVTSTSVGHPSTEPLTATAASGSQPAGESGPWKLWFWSLVFAAVVCFAAVGVLRLRWASMAAGPPPEDRPFTVLADVDGTASPEIREAVTFLLRSGLDMAHVVQTVPLPDVERTLSLLDRNPESAIDAALAREVAARLGVRTVVLPRLDRLGEEYVLGMRVEDVGDGVLRADVRSSADGEAGIVQLADQVVRQIRRRLGEARAVLGAAEPLPEVLTPSIQALEAYQAGSEFYLSGDLREAATELEEAVSIDTAFAEAWIRLGQTYSRLGSPDSATFANERALRFQDRLTEGRRADRIFVRRVETDVALWDLAFRDVLRAGARHPDALMNYPLYLAGYGGRPDSALSMAFRSFSRGVSQARRLDPSRQFASVCWLNHLYWVAALGRTHEWLSLLDSLKVDFPPDCAKELALYEQIAAAEWDAADSLLREGTRAYRWLDDSSEVLTQLEGVRGRIQRARSRLSPESPSLEGEAPTGISATVGLLLLELSYGPADSERSRREERARPLHRDPTGSDPAQMIAFVLHGVRESLVGDTLEAKRVLQRLQAKRDSATSRTFEAAFEPWFALLDVGPAYRRGDWTTVIQRLEGLEARIHLPGIGHMAGDAYLVRWLLADAYVGLGQPGGAIPFLESILERPTARIQDWTLQGFIHPAARFRLAGLYVETGETEKAREQYRIFLDTFTAPDPEVQWMVEEAQSRLDSLSG
jgi:tetratricopeptide (TPR) repeat protein